MFNEKITSGYARGDFIAYKLLNFNEFFVLIEEFAKIGTPPVIGSFVS